MMEGEDEAGIIVGGGGRGCEFAMLMMLNAVEE